MNQSTHPLARDSSAVRLLEHNLMEIEALLGADSFTLDGDEITFRRRAAGAAAATAWSGHLGDWLVRDGAGYWRVVDDEPATIGQPVREHT